METLCEIIERKLLDPPGTPLTGEEIQHLKLCSSCGEARKNSFLVGGSLTEIARRKGANKKDQLPAALKLRVGDLIREELEQERKAEKHTESLTKKKKKIKEHRWGYYFGLPPWFWRGAKWSAATAVLALVVMAGFNKWSDRQPIGDVRFSSGSLALTGRSGKPIKYKNLHDQKTQPFKRGAKIKTDPNAPAILVLGGKVKTVQCVLDGSTKLALEAKDEIVLESGSIWLTVTPGGRGFLVHTPHGKVRVTGTDFGVSDTGTETRVHVVKGKVLLEGPKAKGEVIAGYEKNIGTWGLSKMLPASSVHPDWVVNVFDAQEKANTGYGSSLPSLSVPAPAPTSAPTPKQR